MSGNEEKDLKSVHRDFAIQTNGETWNLLGKTPRSMEEDFLLVHCAHASLYHWLHAGTGVHQQRGTWLLSHVYAQLGLGEMALRYAQECMRLTEQHSEEMADFDQAYAQECLARAFAVLGDLDNAAEYRSRAQAAGELISGEEDRKIFMGDLNGGNWGKLAV